MEITPASPSSRRLWIALATVILLSFTVLIAIGQRVKSSAPPIPDHVVTSTGEEVMGPGEVLAGQAVWQAMGGMQVGSIWGHGSYVAPDWTADYLHREAMLVLDAFARAEHGREFASLTDENKAAFEQRLTAMFRRNTFDPATGTLTIPAERARAFHALGEHYADLFSRGRREMAIPAGAQTDPAKLRLLTGFFFWSAWAASTDRPGLAGVSYTNNWPHERLVGNRITGDAVMWTGVSIIVLLAGIVRSAPHRAANVGNKPSASLRHLSGSNLARGFSGLKPSSVISAGPSKLMHSGSTSPSANHSSRNV